MLPVGGRGALQSTSTAIKAALTTAVLPRPQDHLPYSNTRLVLRSEVEDEDSYFFGGTVVRLWSSANSHPAVRGNLQGLEPL